MTPDIAPDTPRSVAGDTDPAAPRDADPAASRDAGSAAPHDTPRLRRGGRRRGMISVAALLGAACSASAAFAPWWRREYDDPLTGRVTVSLSGSNIIAALVPVALVALAGLGAILMTRGILQRLLGVLLMVAGVGVVGWSIVGMVVVPGDALTEQLQRPAEPVTAATMAVTGQLLGIVGGLLIALAGGVVAAVGAASAARSSAYDSPATQRERLRGRAANGENAGAPSYQVDAAADGSDLWRALDAGMDPTDAEMLTGSDSDASDG